MRRWARLLSLVRRCGRKALPAGCSTRGADDSLTGAHAYSLELPAELASLPEMKPTCAGSASTSRYSGLDLTVETFAVTYKSAWAENGMCCYHRIRQHRSDERR